MSAKSRILIVEDERIVAEDIRRSLIRLSYDVVDIVSSGEDAFRVVQEMRPDLVLMDVVMPGLNGFQATRELASDPETSCIPVIIVTRKNQEVDRVWGMRQGASNYLTKPVKESSLVELINDTLDT